ncbi:6934_t:CDS:2, partial [Dentiscutata heterogama]
IFLAYESLVFVLGVINLLVLSLGIFGIVCELSGSCPWEHSALCGEFSSACPCTLSTLCSEFSGHALSVVCGEFFLNTFDVVW